MKQLELFLIATCIVISSIGAFDFIVYAVKTGDKSSVKSKRFWGTIRNMPVYIGVLVH